MVRWIEVKQPCNVLNAVPNTFVRTVTPEANTHHLCVDCGRQFIDVETAPKILRLAQSLVVWKCMLTAWVKEAPSPVTFVHQTTVIYCLKQVGKNLAGATPGVAYSITKANKMSGKLWSVQKKKLGSGSRRQLTTRSRGYEMGCCPLDCASAPLHLIGQLWVGQCYEY